MDEADCTDRTKLFISGVEYALILHRCYTFPKLLLAPFPDKHYIVLQVPNFRLQSLLAAGVVQMDGVAVEKLHHAMLVVHVRLNLSTG